MIITIESIVIIVNIALRYFTMSNYSTIASGMKTSISMNLWASIVTNLICTLNATVVLCIMAIFCNLCIAYVILLKCDDIDIACL